MKFIIFKIKPLFLAFLYLVFFELLSYFLLNRNIFNLYFTQKGIWYFILIDIVLIIFSFLWLMSMQLEKKAFKIIMPVIFNISIFLFLFSSSFFLFHQIVIILSFFLFLSLFINLEEEVRFKFINAVSFFSAFLFFFGMYFLLYTFHFSYWIIILIIIVFSSSLLYYMLEHIDISVTYRNLFLVLFSIIIAETFLMSLFWPISSLFLKSLILVTIYYLYWGILDMYLRNFINRANLIKYFTVFILILVLIIFSLLVKPFISIIF